MDKMAELIKAGKLKEISDVRDETDLNGLKLAIDLKRGTDQTSSWPKLLPGHPPHGFPVLQLQHPHRRHAQSHGCAGDFGGVDRLAYGLRAPQGLLQHEKEAG